MGSQQALLDVRPRGHFAFSHLDGARNLPLAELLALSPQDLRSTGESRKTLRAKCGSSMERSGVGCVCLRFDNPRATVLELLLR